MKNLIIWTSLKFKTSALWKTPLREWKDKQQTGRKYLQMHIWWKTCIQTHKEHLKLNSKKKKIEFKRWAKEPNVLHQRRYTNAKYVYKKMLGPSLVVQWLRIHLAMQGTPVWSLVQEDPTCCGTTKPISHNHWVCVQQLLKPMCSRAWVPQQEKPPQWEAWALQLQCSPCSLQREKVHEQQWRPSAAIDTFFKKVKKEKDLKLRCTIRSCRTKMPHQKASLIGPPLTVHCTSTLDTH